MQCDKHTNARPGIKQNVMCNICYFQSNYFSMFIYSAFILLFIYCNISSNRVVRELCSTWCALYTTRAVMGGHRQQGVL